MIFDESADLRFLFGDGSMTVEVAVVGGDTLASGFDFRLSAFAIFRLLSGIAIG